MKDYEKFNSEALDRWGNTEAYHEHIEKTKNYSNEKWSEANDRLMSIFSEFAALKNSGVTADSTEAQALVAGLQAYITDNYYTSTDEILAGLGKMYACDERFKNNIDKNGAGTANFVSCAIQIYCKGSDVL